MGIAIDPAELDNLNLLKIFTMDTPLQKQFRDIIETRKELSNDLYRLVERLKFLIQERRDKNLELKSLIMEIENLKIEKQGPISGGAKSKLEIKIEILKGKTGRQKGELRDMDKIIEEHRNQQRWTWDRIRILWAKQREIWREINPQTDQDENEKSMISDIKV